MEREAEHEGLAAPVDRLARDALQDRARAVGQLLELGYAPVAARHHPGRGALIDVEMADGVGDGRADLDRGRAGADQRDPLAGEVGVVVPAGGVEELAAEGLDARDVGQVRLAQRADGADQDVGGEVAVRWCRPATASRRRPSGRA